MRRVRYADVAYGLLPLAEGVNEIMDYLEDEVSKVVEYVGHRGKNGKLFTCVNCRRATGYPGDLGKCCDKPLYEVSD